MAREEGSQARRRTPAQDWGAPIGRVACGGWGGGSSNSVVHATARIRALDTARRIPPRCRKSSEGGKGRVGGGGAHMKSLRGCALAATAQRSDMLCEGT